MFRAASRLRQQRPWRGVTGPVARVALGVAGAGAGLGLAGRARRWVGPLQLSTRLAPAPIGGTQVDLPPLGSASVRTHRGPVRLRVAASAVDPERAQGLLSEDADVHAVLHAAQGELAALVRTSIVRGALGAIGGAAVAGGLVGAAGGTAALLGAGALAAGTTDREAWRDPKLTGLLTRLPLLIGELRTAPGRIDTYRRQLAELVRTGTDVYRHVLDLPDGPPDDAIRLLHISDIHLSPVTYPLVRALLESYGIDAVVDTGDLVDWGTPPEQKFADQIGALGVPYVFVKGNHDSTGIAAAVAGQPNATVLDVDSATALVAGLRFAGMADPRFTPDKTTGDDQAEHRVSERAQQFAAELADAEVDVLLAHDPAAARALAGHAPLLLAGHTHRRAARRVGDTIVLTQGSSGGSGLRGVQQDPPTSHTLSVVYVDRASKQPWGVDEVTLGGIGSVRLTVQRRTLADLLGETGRATAGAGA